MSFSSICRDPYIKRWLERMRKHEPNLHQHSLRVGRLASDFYRFCGMEYERGWRLVEGALLHDLGKLCLPAALLTKPRALNEEEKRLVALHPNIGAEMLEAQSYFDKAVINVVRRHHERLDGSGYPNGWRRRRTPKMVRVVAACDAFCALTEERPYENAWSVEDALARLASMPEQYDAEAVRTLRDMLRGKAISITLQEGLSPEFKNAAKSELGVKRPRSAFYTPRRRLATT